MKIERVEIREVFDSRGESTVEVSVTNGNGETRSASIPSGKSRGLREAMVFSPREAHASAALITPHFIGRSFSSLESVDDALRGLDGTDRKEKLGGNVTLGISFAAARLLAAEKREPLWAVIQREFFPHAAKAGCAQPRIFSNLINGGAHASGAPDIQEYMVVVEPRDSILETVKRLIALYRMLGEKLKKKRNITDIPIGDESGYALPFRDNFEPLELLNEVVAESGFDDAWGLACDAAASHFYRDGAYVFSGKSMNKEELCNHYLAWFREVPRLMAIEDPFEEGDGESFGALVRQAPQKLIVGDDLTVTHASTIKAHAEKKHINAVIIKPNQIGTISETCEAIRAAEEHNVRCIASHRSGETEDTWIIHLCRACNAYGVKIGHPARERIVKFNELIRLYS